jgi:hypothetical protein
MLSVGRLISATTRPLGITAVSLIGLSLAACGGSKETSAGPLTPAAFDYTTRSPFPPHLDSSLRHESFTANQVNSACYGYHTGSFEGFYLIFRAQGTASGPFTGTFRSQGSADVHFYSSRATYYFHERFRIHAGSRDTSGAVNLSSGTLAITNCESDGYGGFNLTGARYHTPRSRGSASAMLNAGVFRESFR